jgi:glycosyltransferase involved in cell wall biosynthesis
LNALEQTELQRSRRPDPFACETSGSELTYTNVCRRPEMTRQGGVESKDRVQVAVVCDLLEERWRSMDLVAEMLLEHLGTNEIGAIQATRICPRMVKGFTGLPVVGKARLAFNADRLINRFLYYPRRLAKQRSRFDVFHIVDHSYAQLIHSLPHNRTVITCHDLSAFHCLLAPARSSGRRSLVFRIMAKRILGGLVRAARVVCDSEATRRELLANDLVPAERTVVVPNGVHPACSPNHDPTADTEAAHWLGPVSTETPELLHVGSAVPRKRIETLLKVFAEVKPTCVGAHLIRVRSPFTAKQSALSEQLGVGRSVVVLPSLDPAVLAAVYRRAALLLFPSSYEGFGLPVVEAMACGLPVVLSDLPVLREVGGSAAVYCPVDDVAAWSKAVTNLLRERACQPKAWAARRLRCLEQAAKFSWARTASRLTAVYLEVMQGP